MKKFIAALLTVVLLMSLTAGCGSTGSKEEAAGTADTNTDASQSSSADTSSGSEEAEAPEVHVFNIYSIGEDFKNRVQDFYPGYESTGENSGQISGVPVMWHVYTDAQEYRDVLDEKLGSQIDGSEEGADPDDRIDLFVVEEAFLRDYVESAASMDVVEEVGLLQESQMLTGNLRQYPGRQPPVFLLFADRSPERCWVPMTPKRFRKRSQIGRHLPIRRRL